MADQDEGPITNLHPAVEAAASTGDPDPAVQQWQAQAASMIQDHLQQQAMIDQAQQQRQQFIQGTATTRDNLTDMVRKDPTATSLAFQLADHFTEALGASHPDEDAGAGAASDMSAHFKGEIAKAAVQGWAGKDAGMARAALDRYGEHLSDDEKSGLDGYISNVATFRNADQQAAQISQAHQSVQRSNQGTSFYMKALTEPQTGAVNFPPDWGQKVMQDPSLAPDAKAALFNGYTNLQRNGEPLASDPNLVTDLLQRSALAYNHPDHPLTPEIAGHLGTNLTMADAQFLASRTGPQSSASRLGTQQLVQTLGEAQDQIGNPQAYGRFVDWLLPRVRNGAILDPGHKDYLLTPERMAQFQPTGDDIIAPALSSTGHPRPSLGEIFSNPNPRGFAMRSEPFDKSKLPQPPVGVMDALTNIPRAIANGVTMDPNATREQIGARAYNSPMPVHGEVFNPPPRETMASLGIDKTTAEEP